MKNKCLLILVTLLSVIGYSHAQMPTDGDYTYWDWESQSIDNWKRKNGNNWIYINPPFSNITDKTDLLYQIFQTKDYTKKKGWRIIYAQFNGTYPYFILYNIYKSVIRAFIYNESEHPSTYLMFSLTLQNNKVKLLGGNCPASATEVEDNTENADIFTTVNNFPGLNTWSVFEVPILFDDRLTEHSVFPLMWSFRFARYNEFNIKLKINGTAKPISPEGSNFVGSNSALNNSTNTFEAKYTKYQKKVQDIDKLLENMHQMANKISDDAPSFLQDYKEMIKGLKGTTDVVHAVSSLSSAAGAIFGIFNFFSSAVSGNKSATSYAYDFNGTLEGNMSTYSNIRVNNLQIPGTGDMGDYQWIPFNCPMGILNLQKTPTIKATDIYQRYGFNSPKLVFGTPKNIPTYIINMGTFPTLMAGGEHGISPNHNEQHSGKYRQYKFDEDITLIKQEINGLTLKDVKFALICKPIGTGRQKYKITSKYLSYHYFYSDMGLRYELPQENLVYTKLCNKQLVIHRFDEENDEILYGTPYIPMNQFKGITLEVPDDTEVSLGVMATFNSIEFDTPILFKAMYKLEIQNIGAPTHPLDLRNGFIGGMTPFNFPEKDYYVTEDYSLNTGPNSGSYIGKSINLLPGFHGVNGFYACAQQYKGVGNTVINSINYNCNSMPVAGTKKWRATSVNDLEELSFKVYPNPLTPDKRLHIVGDEQISSLIIYNSFGQPLYIRDNVNQSSTEIDLSSFTAGIYYLYIKTNNENYSTKIVVN